MEVVPTSPGMFWVFWDTFGIFWDILGYFGCGIQIPEKEQKIWTARAPGGKRDISHEQSVASGTSEGYL